MIATL